MIDAPQPSALEPYGFEINKYEHWPCNPGDPYHAWTSVTMTISATDDNEEQFVVASANGFDLSNRFGQDIFDILDTDSSETAMYLELVMSNVLPSPYFTILDRVWVRPENRGKGFGPLIAAMLIEDLDICDAVLTIPAPIELVETGTPGEIKTETERLRKLWARLGFRQHEESEVFWLEYPNHEVGQTVHNLSHLLD